MSPRADRIMPKTGKSGFPEMFLYAKSILWAREGPRMRTSDLDQILRISVYSSTTGGIIRDLSGFEFFILYPAFGV